MNKSLIICNLVSFNSNHKCLLQSLCGEQENIRIIKRNVNYKRKKLFRKSNEKKGEVKCLRVHEKLKGREDNIRMIKDDYVHQQKIQ